MKSLPFFLILYIIQIPLFSQTGLNMNDRDYLDVDSTIDVFVGVGIDLTLGRRYHDFVLDEPRENWQSDFSPPGGSMRLVDVYEPGYIGSELTYELAARYKSNYFGIHLSRPFEDLYLAEKQVSWWDPVAVTSLTLDRSFRYGIVAGRFIDIDHIDIKGMSGADFNITLWTITLAAHKYKILSHQHEGVDVPGKQNYSREISSSVIEDGIGIRAELRIQFIINFFRFRFEANFESNGFNLNQFGGSIGLDITPRLWSFKI